MSDVMAITYEGAVAVTKSDSVDDPSGPFAGFYTGTGGDISVVTMRGQSVLFAGTPAGTVMTVAIRRVNSAATVATGILGMLAMPFKGKPVQA